MLTQRWLPRAPRLTTSPAASASPDVYTQDFRARDESRAILSANGYVPIAKDVSVMFSPVSPNPIPFEDWWVDPQVVSPEMIETFQAINASTGLPQNLLFAS